jgi:hypothetical protein
MWIIFPYLSLLKWTVSFGGNSTLRRNHSAVRSGIAAVVCVQPTSVGFLLPITQCTDWENYKEKRLFQLMGLAKVKERHLAMLSCWQSSKAVQSITW